MSLATEYSLKQIFDSESKMNNNRVNEEEFKKQIASEIFKELSRKFHDINIKHSHGNNKSVFHVESHPNELGNGIIEIEFNNTDSVIVDVTSENSQKCDEFIKELTAYFGDPIQKTFKTPEQREAYSIKKGRSLDA
jgi:hypothetical protein